MPLQYQVIHSHKMAIALCARLAHLTVLKLSSELHGGGTGRAKTTEIMRSLLLLGRFSPSNMLTNNNSRKFSSPAHFFPHLKRKNLYTSVCIGEILKKTQE